LKKIPDNSIFINLGFSKTNFPNSDKICPAILASNKIWCVKKKRYANIKELLSLQGFNKNFLQVVSNTQLKKQIGNSMSVNVLKEIFIQLEI
jgi:site-specific DNA-cytosine methylase